MSEEHAETKPAVMLPFYGVFPRHKTEPHETFTGKPILTELS